MQSAVVLGTSPAALRTALWLARDGVRVRVLGTGEALLEGPDLPPWGEGCAPVREGDTSRLAVVWPDGVAHPAPERGMLYDDRVHAVPLSRRDLVGALGLRETSRVARDAVRSRTRNKVETFMSVGQEERSYQGYVSNRLGPRFFEKLYAGYAERRYGATAADLTAWLGWRTHGRGHPDAWQVAGTDAGAWLDGVRHAVLEGGGEILEHAEIDGLEVEGGRVVAVVAEHGRELVDEMLFVDASPRTVAAWLPEEHVDPWRFHLTRLDTVDVAQVTLRADADALPWLTDLLGGRLVWRLTRPGLLPGGGRWIGWVTAQVVLPPGHSLAAANDAALEAAVRSDLDGVLPLGSGEAIVQRQPAGRPLHRLRSIPSLQRVLDAWDGLGIVGVGPRGAHRYLDLADELALLDVTLGQALPDERGEPARVCWQREAHRLVAERPVRLPGEIERRIGVCI